MPELNTGRQKGRAGPGDPGHQGLGDLALLESSNDPVLVLAAQLAQACDHLYGRIHFIAHYVVQHGGAGIAISSDGHTLVNAVGVAGDYIEGLIEHASRLGDESHTSRPVELGGDDILNGSRSIADAKSPRSHAAHCGRSYDYLAFGAGCSPEDAGLPFRNALGYNRHNANALLGQRLHAGIKGRAVAGEVDHHIRFRIGLGRQRYCPEHGQDDLLASPEGLVNAGPAGIDDGGYAGAVPVADIIEVQHALDGIGLKAVDESLGASVE